MADAALPGLRQYWQDFGKKKFLAGHCSHSHGLMRGTAAIGDFLIGYTAAKKQFDAAVKQRVDARQGA